MNESSGTPEEAELSPRPDFPEGPLEVAAQHQRHVRIRLAAPEKALGEGINTVGMVQTRDVV